MDKNYVDICSICGKEPAYKTDGQSRLWCKKCLDKAMYGDPKTRDTNKQQRNDVCACGSGKKYKKCCINKES